MKKCPTCNSSRYKKHIGENISSCKRCGYVNKPKELKTINTLIN